MEFARRRPRRSELYPSLAFDRLFKDGVGKGDRSVLDAVLSDAKSFRLGISSSDQRKFDEYLESVREIEQRIDQAGKRGSLEGWRPTLDKPNVPRPPDGIPQNIADHMRLMCDILVLGFQTDATRVCTLKLNNDHSSLRFPHLNVDYMIHHLLSHSDTADWLKVNQFFLQQVGYVARKMNSIHEGERTLLDNSMLLFCSSMLHGRPRRDEAAGRGAGRRGRPDQGRPRARLPRQAQPQDVQPVLVNARQVRYSPRQVRRLDGATGGRIIRARDWKDEGRSRALNPPQWRNEPGSHAVRVVFLTGPSS